MYFFGGAEIFELFGRSSLHKLLSANHLEESIIRYFFFFLLKEQWTGYATQIIPLKQLFSYCFVSLFVCLLFGFVFDLNQLDPPENVEVEIKKNKISRSVDESAQAVLNRLLVSSAIYWIRYDWYYCTYKEPHLIIRV